MSAMHFYAWRSGLKTGQYYFRSRPARDAIKFTVNVDMLLKAADGGNMNQVMECLNVDKDRQNKKQKLAKPASLKSGNMPIEELKLRQRANTLDGFAVPADKQESEA